MTAAGMGETRLKVLRIDCSFCFRSFRPEKGTMFKRHADGTHGHSARASIQDPEIRGISWRVPLNP